MRRLRRLRRWFTRRFGYVRLVCLLLLVGFAVMRHAGSMTIGDGAALPLSGTINNTGSIALNSTGTETDLQIGGCRRPHEPVHMKWTTAENGAASPAVVGDVIPLDMANPVHISGFLVRFRGFRPE